MLSRCDTRQVPLVVLGHANAEKLAVPGERVRELELPIDQRDLAQVLAPRSVLGKGTSDRGMGDVQDVRLPQP
jgi:hypothetical protein